MATLRLMGSEFATFPPILREYASYTSTIKGNSEHTVCEYLLDLRTFFRFIKCRRAGNDPEQVDFEKIGISDITLDDIRTVTPSDIIEFLVYASYGRNNKGATRMRKVSAVRSFFQYLHAKKHLIEVNPAAEIDPPKKSKALPKYLNLEESKRLLEAVRNDTESKTVDRDFAIITLFLNTGMRLSELVGLNLGDLDSEIHSVKVLGKGAKERMIYLNTAARSALKNYMRARLDPRFVKTSDKALFLSKRQQRISTKTVQWMIYKYLDLAGLGSKGLSVHKLRHTAATLMYQSGKVDIRVLKDILGHEQLNTTQIYTHVVSRNMEEAVENNPLSTERTDTHRRTDD